MHFNSLTKMSRFESMSWDEKTKGILPELLVMKIVVYERKIKDRPEYLRLSPIISTSFC